MRKAGCKLPPTFPGRSWIDDALGTAIRATKPTIYGLDPTLAAATGGFAAVIAGPSLTALGGVPPPAIVLLP